MNTRYFNASDSFASHHERERSSETEAINHTNLKRIRQSRPFKTEAGLTLIELMTVIGISGLLAFLAFFSYGAFRKNVELTDMADQLMNTLRTAQNKSIVSQDGADHGVYIEANQYTLYQGDNWSAPGRIIIATYPTNGYPLTVSTGSADIVFERLTGQAATQTVVQIGSSDPKSITIQSIGTISST